MEAPELVHVATMKAPLGEQLVVGAGAMGMRIVAEVDDLTIEGERLNASLAGKSIADWLTLGHDGSYGTLDVRATVRTDDGELIYIEYGGKIDLTAGRVASAPTMQTGSEKYAWVNSVQFIGDGTLDRDTNVLTYELYEIKLA